MPRQRTLSLAFHNRGVTYFQLPSSPREIATSYLKFYMKGSYLPPRENFKLPYLPNQAH